MDFFPLDLPDVEVVPYWFDGMVRLGYVLHDNFLSDQSAVAAGRDRGQDRPRQPPVHVVAQPARSATLEAAWPYAKWMFNESPDDFYYALPYCSAHGRQRLTACYAGSARRRECCALTTAYGGEHGWIDGHLVFPERRSRF